jgi:hypothetical protein
MNSIAYHLMVLDLSAFWSLEITYTMKGMDVLILACYCRGMLVAKVATAARRTMTSPIQVLEYLRTTAIVVRATTVISLRRLIGPQL